MKISSVEIQKFRSIKYAKFDLNNITAVVGENNAGKTAVLRAINAFMNFQFEKTSFETKRHQYGAKTNSYITLTFSDIPNKDYYQEKIYMGKLTITFVYFYGNNKRKYIVYKGNEKVNVDESFIDLISNDISYVYIPAGRTNKDVSWNDNSILREVVTSYAAQYTVNRDTLSVQVRKATDKIHKTVLIKLENLINDLYMQNKSVDFNLEFPNDLDYSFLLDKIQFSLNEYSSKYSLREWGSGTKSLAVIALHRANALLKNRSIVLGIEEPETNLHPQAQKRFILSLKNNLRNNETQTIFTTHSTVLVNALAHEDILLLRREPDEKRGFFSTATQLPKNFWEKYNIEEFKHYQYFNYKNSDFFFSKYIVLGESKIDCQVFEKLIEDELGDSLADISFLDAGGVENLKYPYYLLKELKIPFITIVDKDFFFEYKNNNVIDDSRDLTTGLPYYGETLKNEPIILDIFNTARLQEKLVETNVLGYRKFFEFIKQFKILSMNYCLEMDLTCSSKARDMYYSMLNIMPENQTQKQLLTSNYKAIKRAERILKIVEELPKRNMPESYSKIKSAILSDIRATLP